MVSFQRGPQPSFLQRPGHRSCAALSKSCLGFRWRRMPFQRLHRRHAVAKCAPGVIMTAPIGMAAAVIDSPPDVELPSEARQETQTGHMALASGEAWGAYPTHPFWDPDSIASMLCFYRGQMLHTI
ncbi:hypothetical protein LY76DRAFT_376339 [Colletotrichum caudatum]|nr:hypothetical protein LY76DRAFT_376339 [Colletotrichum caudatum]